MINTPKPSSAGMTNSSKVVDYESWDTNASTWDTEVRTWNEMGTLMSNTTKPAGYTLWSAYSFPWLMDAPWQTGVGMTNTPKPS
jgi:hypothetical protein